ncbi:hypothetical protein [Treponema socranskii]|jgi:hypothetical protein|uniref:hypothetical protein n=1 Tax=Treponema socranskii TaxID=53419 RepID=UPI003D6E526B
MKGLLAFVFIGAKIITFDYTLADLRFNYADKDSGLFVRILFQPTAENSPFRIVEKSPFNMTAYLQFLSEDEIEKIEINKFELILDSGERVSLSNYIDWLKIDNEFSNVLFFEKSIVPVSKSMSFRFEKLPLNEEKNINITVHIDMDLYYINKLKKKYDSYIPFRLTKHIGRWVPTT